MRVSIHGETLHAISAMDFIDSIEWENIPESLNTISQVRMQDALSQVKNVCYVAKVRLNIIPESYQSSQNAGCSFTDEECLLCCKGAFE